MASVSQPFRPKSERLISIRLRHIQICTVREGGFMPRKDPQGDVLRCSFCGKSQEEVKRLIAGPAAYICDECIDLCNDIILEEGAAEHSKGHRRLLTPRELNQK